MKIKLKVRDETSSSELAVLSAFFGALSLAKGGKVISQSADSNDLHVEPGDDPTPDETVVVKEAGYEPVKRRRRTKAEMAAAAASEAAAVSAAVAAVAAAEPEFEEATVAELEAILSGDPCVEELTREQYEDLRSKQEAAANPTPAPTPPAQQPATPPSETASSAPASEYHSEMPVPTVDALNKRAGALVRRIGPDVIKAKIVELGGTTIASLSIEGRIEFGQWLAEQEASA